MPLQLLNGTPYSVPDDLHAREQLELLFDKESQIRATLADVRSRLDSISAGLSLDDAHTTREIFESNRIEGLGPDIARTHEILQSAPAKSLSDAFDETLFTSSLQDDADIRAVLTLHGARLVAGRVRESVNQGRPFTEADVRMIHSVICHGEWHAGRYRSMSVEINAQDHRPPPAEDVNRAMAELMAWIREGGKELGTIGAAAAHAWLTHIHPFDDGNGRLARLVANMILLQSGLPPAVVKSSNQRESYLDALAHSDSGGDIFPLAGLFMDTMKKRTREVKKPQFAARIFQDELARRKSGTYDWWSTQFNNFLNTLAAELSLSRLEFRRVGAIDKESFANLQARNSEGNSWIAIVKDELGREMLLWCGYPSFDIQAPKDEKRVFPSIFLSVKAGAWSLHRFARANLSQSAGLREIALYPGTRVEVRTVVEQSTGEKRTRRGSLDDAVSEISDHIVRGFRSNTIPK